MPFDTKPRVLFDGPCLYKKALEKCTNALRIHGRYMNAILRHARCYSRLQQIAESGRRPIGNVSQCRLHLSCSARCQGCGDRTSKGGIGQCTKSQTSQRNHEVKTRKKRSVVGAQQRSNFQENSSASLDEISARARKLSCVLDTRREVSTQ
jgi:hypothetical protein